MAQFRSTADILDLALQKAGEVTNGNSPYETQALNYLNSVHFALVAGGTIPIGKDTTVEIDETWPWAKAKSPLSLKLQPKITTGTVSLTNGSVSGTFSSAPASSLEGWYLRVVGQAQGLLRIAHHAAAATSFSLDDEFLGTTGTTLSYEAIKLDYELIPELIVTNSENDKIQFQETAGTTITGTLTRGVRSPSAYITHVVSVLNTAGGTPVYTGSYDASTRKFTINSDRGGSSVFVIVGTGDQSHRSAHKPLGLDDENTTNAASVVSTYALGGIARLVEPFRVVDGSGELIFGVDSETFAREFPLSLTEEGRPTHFSVVREDADGRFVVRFNSYPASELKVEVEHVPVPRDLKDSASSIPIVPRKHVDALQDAAIFFIMMDKSDDRAQTYANLLQGKLKSMISQHRGSLVKSGRNFGAVIPRRDNMPRRKRNLFGSEPY